MIQKLPTRAQTQLETITEKLMPLFMLLHGSTGEEGRGENAGMGTCDSGREHINTFWKVSPE